MGIAFKVVGIDGGDRKKRLRNKFTDETIKFLSYPELDFISVEFYIHRHYILAVRKSGKSESKARNFEVNF